MPRLSAAAGEGFAFLAANLFVLVADALALVRLRRTDVANFCGELADFLLVRTLDDNRGRVRHIDRDAGRRHHQHAVGETNRQLHALVFGCRLVTDALDFQAFFVTLGDALDHVGDDAARQTVQRAREALIIGPGDADDLGVLVHLDFDEPMIGELQLLPLRSFHEDFAIGDLDFDAGRNGHGLFADTRHTCSPKKISDPGSRASRNLPHRTEQFATQFLGAGLAVAHDAAASADDANAQTIEHWPKLFGPAIQTPAGPAGPLDVPDDALAFRPIIQIDSQEHVRLAEILILHKRLVALFIGLHSANVVIEDESFVLEHLSNGDFKLGGRDVHGRSLDAVGVADAGQHVG